MTRPVLLRRFFAALVCIPVAALLLTGGLFAFMQTDMGRLTLARWLSSTLSSDGMQVEIHDLHGTIPWNAHVERITVSDAQGPWLRMEDFRLTFSPGALWNGLIHFPLVQSDSAAILRRPTADESPDARGLPTLPALNLPRIRIDTLSIPELVVHEPLVQHQLHLTVQGSTRMEDRQAQGELNMSSRQGPQTTLRASFRLQEPLADEPDARLTLYLDFQEAEGGLLGSFLPPGPRSKPLHITLQGEGPLSDWQGGYLVDLGTDLNTEGDLALRIEDRMLLRLTGNYTLDPSMLPEWVRDIPGRSGNYGLTLLRAETGDVELEALSLTSKTTTLDLPGTIDLTRGRFDSPFTLTSTLPPKLLRQYHIAVQGPTIFKGTLQGSFERPVMRIGVTAPSMAAGGFRLGETEVRAETRWTLQGVRPGLDLNATLKAASLSGPGLAAQATPLSLSLSGSTPDFRTLVLDGLQVSAPRHLMSADGQLDLDEMDVSARIRLAEFPLSMLGAPVPSLDGVLNLDMTASGSIADLDLHVRMNGEADRLQGFPAQLGELIGDRIAWTAQGSLQDGVITLTSLKAFGPGRLDANGTLRTRDKLLRLDFALTPERLSELVATSALEIPQPPDIRGTLHGYPRDFSLQLQAQAPRLILAGRTLLSPSLTASMDALPATNGTARIEARADVFNRPVEAGLNLQLVEDHLLVDTLIVHSGPSRLTADLAVPLDLSAVSGSGELTIPDLGSWKVSPALDVLQGGLRADFTVQDGPEPKAFLSGEVTSLSLADLRLAEAAFEVRVSSPFNEPRVTASLGVRDGQWRTIHLTEADMELEGGLDRFDFQLEAAGNQPTPARLIGTGTWQRLDKGFRLTLADLEGTAEAIDFSLSGPADILVADQALSVSNLALQTEAGSLGISGSASQKALDLELIARDMDLQVLAAPLQVPLWGRLTGNAGLSGNAEAPRIDASFTVQDFRIESFRSHPADLDITLNMTGQRTDLQGTVAGFGSPPGSFRLEVPAGLRLLPPAIDFRQADPVSGHLSGNLEMEIISRALALEDMFFDGPATADVSLSGTWNDPGLTGQVQLEHGSFENLKTGSAVTDIHGTLSFQGDPRLRVALKGSDSAAGRIELTGTLDFPPFLPLAYDLRIQASQARLFRLDRFHSTVTGHIDARGDTDQLDLTGDVRLDPSELSLRSGASKGVTNIPVTEINIPGENATGTSTDDAGFATRLDISVSVPARFYVRGLDLDSEWQGQVDVSGTAGQPRLDGTLNLVRGSYSFLGKTFRLDRGTVDFDGSSPPNPFVDLVAINRGADIEARVKLNGRVNNLSLGLESDPSMPRDEILSRVLFGRSLTQLSPLQALQLAQAVSKLTGSGPGLDPLGETRQLLGVDELSIGEGQEGGTTLGVGKYLHEDVYIRGEKGLTPEDDSVSIEVEITPEISIESEVGGTGRGGVELFWKKDY